MKVLFVSDCVSGATGKSRVGGSNLRVLVKIVGRENVDAFLVSSCESDLQTDLGGRVFRYLCSSSKLALFIEGLVFRRHFRCTKEVQCEFLKYIDSHHYDVVFFDDSYFGGLVYLAKKKYPKAKLITFFHNFRYDLSVNWLYRNPLRFFPFFFATRYQEKLSAIWSTNLVSLTSEDACAITRRYRRKVDAVIPVCVTEVAFLGKGWRAFNGNLKIGFVGASYHPNVRAARWFVESVMPELQGCDFFVVGNGMEQHERYINRSHNKNVSVQGYVDDLTSWYAGVDLVVAPIFEGGGMKVKIAEAMAHGKAVLASPDAAKGYALRLGGVCTSADDFKRTICALKAAGGADELIAYREYVDNHSVESCAKRMLSVLP